MYYAATLHVTHEEASKLLGIYTSNKLANNAIRLYCKTQAQNDDTNPPSSGWDYAKITTINSLDELGNTINSHSIQYMEIDD